MKTLGKIRYWIPALVWMGIIFAFSARPAVQASGIDWQDFFIKKTAHFVEYAVLTTLLIFSLNRTTSWNKTKKIVFAVIISGLYAVSDEFHQSFIPGREPHVRDVLIDALGSLSAGLFSWKNQWIDKLNYRA